MNADKTDFMIFRKKSHNRIADHGQLKVKKEFIEQSKSTKYFGIYVDQNLTYQMEVQNILRKMVTGIKVLYFIRTSYLKKTSSTAEFTSSKSTTLLFDFDKWYFAESSVNFRETIKLGCESWLSQEEIRFIQRSQVTIQNFTCGSLLDLKAVLYFWKYQIDLLPAFKHQQITTAKLEILKRSNLLFYDSMTNSNYLTDSFFKKVVPLWKNLPPELKTKKWTYDTIKTKFEDFFQDK